MRLKSEPDKNNYSDVAVFADCIVTSCHMAVFSKALLWPRPLLAIVIIVRVRRSDLSVRPVRQTDRDIFTAAAHVVVAARLVQTNFFSSVARCVPPSA